MVHSYKEMPCSQVKVFSMGLKDVWDILSEENKEEKHQALFYSRQCSRYWDLNGEKNRVPALK